MCVPARPWRPYRNVCLQRAAWPRWPRLPRQALRQAQEMLPVPAGRGTPVAHRVAARPGNAAARCRSARVRRAGRGRACGPRPASAAPRARAASRPGSDWNGNGDRPCGGAGQDDTSPSVRLRRLGDAPGAMRPMSGTGTSRRSRPAATLPTLAAMRAGAASPPAGRIVSRERWCLGRSACSGPVYEEDALCGAALPEAFRLGQAL